MEYKKTLTGILAGTVIGLGSLFYSADAAPKDKTYVAESSYKDTIKELAGDEVIIETSVEGKKYSFTFEHDLKTIIRSQSARIYALSRNNDTGNLKISFGNLTNNPYVLEIMPTAKDRLPETKVTKLNNVEIAGNKAKGYTFTGMDGVEYFVNMKTGGIVKYNRLPAEQTVEVEGTKGADKNEINAFNVIASATSSEYRNTTAAKNDINPTNNIKTEKKSFESTTKIEQPKAEIKKTEVVETQKEMPKLVPINMIGREETPKKVVKETTKKIVETSKKTTQVYAPKKEAADAGYSSLLDIDAGYTPNVESLNPFTASKKENYTTEVKSNKSRAVLDEEAAGCGCTDLFKESDVKAVPTPVVEKEDAGFEEVDIGVILEIDSGFDAGTEKTVYDAGIVDIGVIISDAGVDSSVKDSGVELPLEPIAKPAECKATGLTNYFVSKKNYIINKMYEGEKELKYFRGDFVFSGSVHNGKFKNLAVNLDKTTLEKGKKEKLEKILFRLQGIPAPQKDQDCSFDEIILKF